MQQICLNRLLPMFFVSPFQLNLVLCDNVFRFISIVFWINFLENNAFCPDFHLNSSAILSKGKSRFRNETVLHSVNASKNLSILEPQID